MTDTALLPLWLLDVVVALVVVEGLALAAYHRATGRGLAPRDFALHLLSGLALLLAWRSTATDGLDATGLAWLLVGGVLHAMELRRRWAQRASQVGAPVPY